MIFDIFDIPMILDGNIPTIISNIIGIPMIFPESIRSATNQDTGDSDTDTDTDSDSEASDDEDVAMGRWGAMAGPGHGPMAPTGMNQKCSEL